MTPRAYTFGMAIVLWVLVLWLVYEVATGARGTYIFFLVMLLPMAFGATLLIRAVERLNSRSEGGTKGSPHG